ncbi:acyl-CoA synthetase [Kordiimonas sp. SCSIO 12610]|uniref:acyl-CoA synthetase n=1 Tax=Kordiimonas sp. SCSIO 12610 TaxID=2829597 RepID=UPI00210B01DB|nr:acyl-CoA synthetase [Kordiimonas sp. SCSIO 12610]UTW56493.1 acyl-CoA synthetase [Kordiimonas sp. SCSIO 12610]
MGFDLSKPNEWEGILAYMDATDPIESVEDIIKLEEVPLETRGLPNSTYEAIKFGSELNPNSPALSFFLSPHTAGTPYVWNHGEFFRTITQAANMFNRLGIERGDVIAFILPNLPETHFTIWGGSAAASVLAINPLLEAEQIGELLATASVKLLVTMEHSPGTDIWEKVSSAVKNVKTLDHILVCNFLEYIKGDGQHTREIDLPPTSASIQDSKISVSRFWEELNKSPDDALTFDAPGPDDYSTLLCTGGTTGLPKIVRRTHRSEVYNCWAASRFCPDAFGQGQTSLCGLPLFHTNAMLVTGLIPWMFGGHVLLTGPSGYRGEGVLAEFWRLVDRYKITTFSGVPTIYSALMQFERSNVDISSIKFGICGAAPMPVDTFQRFIEKTGIPIVEAYGMTEGAVGSSMNPVKTDTPKIGSIGLRFPYQDMAIAIIDDEDQFVRWAETDEAGAILISGPNVFDGYLIDEQNQGIWVFADDKRWFNTGDLARQDAQGYFWMTGRRKELIIRGGHNIDPKMIEEAMHKHGNIALAAAIGRPDARVGEVPILYYQTLNGLDIPATDLLEFANSHIPERAAIPKDFIRLDNLPITAVGKIHKVPLTMREIESLIHREAKALNIDLLSLSVEQDKRLGIVANINAPGDTSSLKQALAQYAVTTNFIQD